MTRVVVAVPTIEVRRHRRAQVEELWTSRTPEADVDVIFSEAGESWAAGLNDVWEQVKNDPPDVFILGSDDMIPADERWLPNAQPWLEQGNVPAPRVEDPRFTNCGGFDCRHGIVLDGAPGEMTAFIIINGEWGHDVFPLPDDLHYFADNYANFKLVRAGHAIVCAPFCRIIHMHAPEGRGAGYGSENTRLYIDTVRYTRALEAEGIDRETLPNAMRGGMWEPHFQEIGTLAGA